jgi:hypothetical protein
MVGPSNKAFEYLACGLGLIVSDLPDWRRRFVDAGLARACDPHDLESLRTAVAGYSARRAELSELGRRAQSIIAADWNYDTQFGTVAEVILGTPGERLQTPVALESVSIGQ